MGVGTGLGPNCVGDGVGAGDGTPVGVRDGSDDGSRVGTGLGSPVGLRDGSDDGSRVGLRDGSDDGSRVGTGLGSPVGAELGSRVGTGLGSRDGVRDGSTLGAGDGSRLGAGDGSRDGAALGSRDGAGDGSLLGTGDGSLVVQMSSGVHVVLVPRNVPPSITHHESSIMSLSSYVAFGRQHAPGHSSGPSVMSTHAPAAVALHTPTVHRSASVSIAEQFLSRSLATSHSADVTLHVDSRHAFDGATQSSSLAQHG